jgi:hypothetical protein
MPKPIEQPRHQDRHEAIDDAESEVTDDEKEDANFNLITTKIRRYFEGKVKSRRSQRRILRMLVLLQFCIIHYDENKDEANKYDIDANEFRTYARKLHPSNGASWWTKGTSSSFSKQFPIALFSGYNKKQGSVKIVDTTDTPLKWKLPERTWSRLWSFLMETWEPIEDIRYMHTILQLAPGPEGWGAYGSKE